MPSGTPIIRQGPVNVPLDYEVPVGAEMIALAVSATFADPTNAGPYVPALRLLTPDGHQLGPFPLGTAIAAGASARVSWFPGGDLDLAEENVSPSGVIVETFYVSSVNSSPHVSSTILQSGRTYLVTVQGTFSLRNVALTIGNPQPDAMFPTSTVGRISTTVGWDAECIFAEQAGGTLGHDTAYRMDIGDGLGMRHIEPVGGPFGAPQPNFFYTYQVIGHGAALQAQIFDSVYTDNYGELLVTIQTVGGGSSGGGGGSLLPDPSLEPDGAWLRTAGGAAVWLATPQVKETDLTLSDVTTQDVSTSKHGFAPKLPGGTTTFLRADGSYATPPGSSPLTTKGDLFGHSSVDARVPIGSDSQVLIADSGQTLGLRWGAVPSGSGGAMTLIASLILGSAQATFDTNAILGGNIPGSYSHLRFVLYGRLSDAVNNNNATMQFNGDTGANYDYAGPFATGAGVITSEGNAGQTSLLLPRIPGASATAGRFGCIIGDIPMYANTVGSKVYVLIGTEAVSTATSGVNSNPQGGTWRSTAAVTRIVIGEAGAGNYIIGSAFFLYGVS